jgi:hypothetical protein
MHVNVDKRNIEIGITDAHKELHGWVEIIGKTANKICDDPDYNRIKLNEHTGFIMESNDAGGLGCLGWAIERHMNDIPSKLKPTFRKILEDTKARKENLERS